MENLPFPNDETEFNLPDEIFEASAKPHSSASESSAVADEGIFNVLWSACRGHRVHLQCVKPKLNFL